MKILKRAVRGRSGRNVFILSFRRALVDVSPSQLFHYDISGKNSQKQAGAEQGQAQVKLEVVDEDLAKS